MSKKLVQINVVCNGSTGRIMTQIQQKAEKQGWETYCFYGRGKPSNDRCYRISNKLDILWSAFLTRFLGKHGYGCKRATKRLVKQLEAINPDIIQLHNIHGYYLHLETLFYYLKKCNKKIIWTLHDCWAFTGHCAHFTMKKCDKWQTQCQCCIQKNMYPKSYIDTSKSEYQKKKEIFTKINNLEIVVPSIWLSNLVKKSFLKEYPVHVIYNGIDLNVFREIEKEKCIEIKKKYHLEKYSKIILGISSVWNEAKGLNDFLRLSKIIKEDIGIVLVGLKDKQIKSLPSNIIGIKKIDELEEIVAIYSMADVFFNPSKEESFSLVTIESIACGTPVVTYRGTAMEEIIHLNNGICLDANEKMEEVLSHILNMEKITQIKDEYSLDLLLIYHRHIE